MTISELAKEDLGGILITIIIIFLIEASKLLNSYDKFNSGEASRKKKKKKYRLEWK